MSSNLFEIINCIVGVIGTLVGIMGCFCLSKANKLKAKEIRNSTINQAETLIVQNGLDSYAVIKLAKETTKEELQTITTSLSATTLDLKKLREELDKRPKIYFGTEPPPEGKLRNGDLYIQYEKEP